MFEITYLVFIRYRGPFGISIPLPRLRTAHVDRPMRPFQSFNPADVLLPERAVRREPAIPCYHETAKEAIS